MERVCFNFLNGCIAAFTPFFTAFFKDEALPEMVEDFVEDVSVGLTMVSGLNDVPSLA